MDEARFLDLISGRRQGWSAWCLRGLLSVLSWGYQPAIRFRNRLYDGNWKRAHMVPVPVVSIGNLTTGGTGKTPMVAYLANWFVGQESHPALLSRGYRALEGVANDEKLVLDQLCPNVPHIQNPDRVAGAQVAIEQEHADVLILDDGFQHRRLARNLDLVLIDATNPWGYGYLLPRGLLREPLSSIRRGDLVVLTRIDLVDPENLKGTREMLSQLLEGNLWVEVSFPPVRLRNASGETLPLEQLKNRPLGAFCGIGNPHGFRSSLEAQGWQIQWMHAFPDHHHYSDEDCRWIGQQAVESGCQILIATQKDLVKISRIDINACPLWAVEIGVQIHTGADLLHGALERLLAQRRELTDSNL